ncbi:MAG: LCP family protein, partial [Selenomonadaceae bacterium]|nr:LCP family protein [Selenomonadaceae bacterium]
VNESGRVRVITIPPDTWISFPGYEGEGRISTLYPRGGEPIMVRAVSNLLGISIHQYIAVDMKTFAELIDILGGIDAYVEEDMNYDDPESGLSIHLQKGYQHMDGDMAQKYLRYRGTGLGDVGRVQRQQRFIKALYQKALQLDTIPKLPAIADIFQHRMTTSAEIFDSAHLANVLRHMNSDVPVTLMLPGQSAEDDDRIWIPNQNEIDLRIRELFPVYEINQGSEE